MSRKPDRGRLHTRGYARRQATRVAASHAMAAAAGAGPAPRGRRKVEGIDDARLGLREFSSLPTTLAARRLDSEGAEERAFQKGLLLWAGGDVEVKRLTTSHTALLVQVVARRLVPKRTGAVVSAQSVEVQRNRRLRFAMWLGAWKTSTYADIQATDVHILRMLLALSILA